MFPSNNNTADIMNHDESSVITDKTADLSPLRQ